MTATTHAHQCPFPTCHNSYRPGPIDCDELPGDCAFEGVETLICYDCAVSTSWAELLNIQLSELDEAEPDEYGVWGWVCPKCQFRHCFDGGEVEHAF